MTTRQDWQTYIRKLRRENASLRQRLRTAGNAEKIRSIHTMTENPTTIPELRERIEHLEQALNIANIKAQQYRHLLVDHYGFDVDNPPADKTQMRQFAEQIGHVVTATFPGEIIEAADGSPAGVTASETFTAPVMGMYVTPRDVVLQGLDPATPGLTIIDPGDGSIIRRNPTDEDTDR